MALEFAARIRRIPVCPVVAGYDLGRDVAKLASNETSFGPLPEVLEAVGRVLSGANRYPLILLPPAGALAADIGLDALGRRRLRGGAASIRDRSRAQSARSTVDRRAP